MTAPLDLKALREVAERATQGYWRWADWSATFGTMENPDRMFCLESVEEGVGPAPRIRKRIEPRCERVLYIEDPVERPEDARHIAAFSPATCIALLDRCERAEAERDGLQTAQNLTATIDRLKSDRDSAIARAEQAEAQCASWSTVHDELTAQISTAESLLDTLEQERVTLARELGEVRAWLNAEVVAEETKCTCSDDSIAHTTPCPSSEAEQNACELRAIMIRNHRAAAYKRGGQ